MAAYHSIPRFRWACLNAGSSVLSSTGKFFLNRDPYNSLGRRLIEKGMVTRLHAMEDKKQWQLEHARFPVPLEPGFGEFPRGGPLQDEEYERRQKRAAPTP
jgi:hypothetical protein